MAADTLIALTSVVVVLGILIFVHEYGHFLAAKLSGVRVEVFSFGFGKRLFGVKRGDTDYRLSALPLGGYVKMAGDNPLEERSGASDEFLSKSRWTRVLIAVAGPTMNILLAFFIFWGVFWLVGIRMPSYLRQAADVVGAPASAAAVSGIRAGDRILKVNGVDTPTWNKVDSIVGIAKPGDTLTLLVLRGGAEQTLTAKVPAKPNIFDLIGYAPESAIADEIGIGSPAEKAGMKVGDVFVSIDGQPVAAWMQLVEAIRNSDGHPLQFIVRRNGGDIPLTVEPFWGMDSSSGQQVWQIGVVQKTKDDYQRQGFLASARDAGIATMDSARLIADVLGGLFTGKVSIRQLSSVVGIARESGRAAKRGLLDLIMLMAGISINLGLLNLLPIPILDGGHVLMLAIEGTLRRELSVAFKERFVQVGLVFLLGISGFVMISDIVKLIQHH